MNVQTFDVAELSVSEMANIDGGIEPVTIFLAGVVVGMIVMAAISN